MFRTRWTTIAISLAIGCASACPAQAAKPAVDYFSAGANPSKAGSVAGPSRQGSFPENSQSGNPTVKLFEKFDETIATHMETEAEHVVLSRPFNQEAERVHQWTDTATKLAKRYRELAKILKA